MHMRRLLTNNHVISRSFNKHFKHGLQV